jgi:hypothetical protein
MDPVLFSPEIEPPRRKKRSIDMGVATILAAGITVFGGITTALILTVLHGPAVAAAQPGPTVTVTAQPHPVATVTVTVTASAHPKSVATSLRGSTLTKAAGITGAVTTGLAGASTLYFWWQFRRRRWHLGYVLHKGKPRLAVRQDFEPDDKA